MKPMNLTKSLVFFGLPGLTIFLLFTYAYPALVKAGMAVNWATYICIWSPLIVMVIGVLIGLLRSNQSPSDYFWVSRLSGRAIWIVVAGFVAVQAGESLLAFTRPIVASLPGFGVPAYFPDLFRPDVTIEIPKETFLGMELSGNEFALVFFGLWLFTNIFCEELLWRGYALPRMEQAFGKWAWLVNGLLWNIAIHFFFRFSFITILPISLVVPYLSQKYKSWWPGVIIHGAGNLLVYVILIPSYFS